MSSDLSISPRRRPFLNANLPRLSTGHCDGRSPSNSSNTVRHATLRKEATFHVSASPSSPGDPVLHLPTLLRRSPTSPDTLQELSAARENRVAGWLGSIERNSTGPGNKSLSKQSSLEDVNSSLKAPRGLNTRLTSANLMEIDSSFRNSTESGFPGKENIRTELSDSGVGSSIGEDVLNRERAGAVEVSTRESVASSRTKLSTGAKRHIQRHVLLPLLKEQRLKTFHSLVRSVPQRIQSSEITCLRDVEKTLLYLAPHHTVSRSSYLSFCEFTIQCVHTTVGYLNDHDQRRPADRPYTNGYFLDLVEQVRQYAVLIRTARERRAASPNRDDLGYSSGEELVLEGGLASTGRPAELVRKKKGQAISLKTGEPFVEQKPVVPSLKRAPSMENQESVMRSMARRKKDAPPMNINEKCKHCDKVFRRPCDLTKHEKVHTRPWKCLDTKCKYHQLGWPTEKERDRHMNDRHSKSPKKFKCLYPGCTYDTKRQSNCKQHMEKLHGYKYVRSKNNGRSSHQLSPQPTPATTNMNSPQAPSVDIPTPISAQAMSPYMSPYEQQSIPFEKPASHGSPSMSTRSSVGYAPSPGVYPGPSPSICSPSEMGQQNTTNDDFMLFPESTSLNEYNSIHDDFNAFYADLQAGDPCDTLPQLDMNLPSVSSTPAGNLATGFHAQSPPDLIGSNADLDFHFDVTENEYTSMNLQLLSPAQSVEAQAMNCLSEPENLSLPLPALDKNSSISPAGHGNVMLYSPASYESDEGFDDGFDYMKMDMGKQTSDFTLFSGSEGNNMCSTGLDSNDSEGWSISSMFPPLGTLNDQLNNADWPQQLGSREMDIDSIMEIDDI
ncbi:zinc finger transcription factor ace1 [Nannizzia gypsea CBS 118893]|uniref:Zinc finger transcription factor ace1 n=1 Tax=Arthroderma gypseum (strain ATCC MYA-4604 / CBS 118893) TaxID=535722 RepID=E4UYK1_ARTGP|nr:zinc finger transcription factor ace1 [Nannizzia gypsea CBS 118893]EFR02164.1 zinc finger transcription factor ace1 [Nannizzia gypsea CBS 118893]